MGGEKDWLLTDDDRLNGPHRGIEGGTLEISSAGIDAGQAPISRVKSRRDHLQPHAGSQVAQAGPRMSAGLRRWLSPDGQSMLYAETLQSDEKQLDSTGARCTRPQGGDQLATIVSLQSLGSERFVYLWTSKANRVIAHCLTCTLSGHSSETGTRTASRFTPPAANALAKGHRHALGPARILIDLDGN